jgi:hypothetical protein
MNAEEWPRIVQTVREMNTVFLLGPQLPSADAQMAQELAEEFDYPFRDHTDLRKVIDYLECTFGGGWTKSVAGRVPLLEDASAFYRMLAMLPAISLITTSMSSDADEGVRRVRRRRENDVVHLHGSIENGVTNSESAFSTATQILRSAHLAIVLGFNAEDGVLGYFTSLPELRYSPEMLIVQEPPPLRNDRRDERRAAEFFRAQTRLRRRTYYHGTPLQFLEELLRRMGGDATTA